MQDVRNISYALTSAKMSVTVNYFGDGNSQTITSGINYSEDPAHTQSKDQIRKTIDGARFVLMVNDVQAAISITPDGEMEYARDVNQSEQGCSLKGSSVISGDVDNKEIDLEWKFKANLNGDGCTSMLKTQFDAFLKDELNRLNIRAAQDLFNALNQSTNNAKGIQLTLRILGDGV